MRRMLLVCVLAAASAAAAMAAEDRIVRLGEEEIRCEEVFHEGFSGGLGNWLAEGDARLGLAGGWLDVDARGGAVTIWCTREFEGAQLVEYDVRLMGDTHQSNVNMFLMASKPGEGIIATTATRNGDYGQYHGFPNYLVTILNNTHPDAKRQMLRVRMRLDPGFELTGEQWHEPLVFGKVYHVAYLVRPPRVSVFLDGAKIGEAEYGKSLERGLHGLRVWHTHSVYDNFRVSRVPD